MKKFLGLSVATLVVSVSLIGCFESPTSSTVTTAKFKIVNKSNATVGARTGGFIMYNRSVTPIDTIINWTATDSVASGDSVTYYNITPGAYLVRIKSSNGLNTWSNSSDITLDAGYITRWELQPQSVAAGSYVESKAAF